MSSDRPTMTNLGNLSDHDLDLKCAQLLGWRGVRRGGRNWGGIPPEHTRWYSLPRFSSDFDGFRFHLQPEIERRGLMEEYKDVLYNAWGSPPAHDRLDFESWLICLTPRQRAEAFCILMENNNAV